MASRTRIAGVSSAAGCFTESTEVSTPSAPATQIPAIRPGILQTGVQTMRKMFVLMLLACVPAVAADVAVSVAVGEPGFYGRIDIGTFPQPRVIIPTSVVIHAIPVGVVR